MPEAPADRALDGAVRALLAGRPVAIPTDTVYGLAVDPSRGGATGRLFAVKGRPRSAQLPVLVASADQAEFLAGPDGLADTARTLMRRFWPGPLTVVVRRAEGLDWMLGGDGSTIGLRQPAHPMVQSLCRQVGPLATTSANRHGEPPLTTAAAVASAFGKTVTVLDGGTCDGAPSTVVDLSSATARCLRVGSIPWRAVLDAVDR